jgi:hypothetical protein
MHTTEVTPWKVSLADANPRKRTGYIVPAQDRAAAIATARACHAASGHPIAASLRGCTQLAA